MTARRRRLRAVTRFLLSLILLTTRHTKTQPEDFPEHNSPAAYCSFLQRLSRCSHYTKKKTLFFLGATVCGLTTPTEAEQVRYRKLTAIPSCSTTTHSVPPCLYFVYISGTPVSGSESSYALLSFGQSPSRPFLLLLFSFPLLNFLARLHLSPPQAAVGRPHRTSERRETARKVRKIKSQRAKEGKADEQRAWLPVSLQTHFFCWLSCCPRTPPSYGSPPPHLLAPAVVSMDHVVGLGKTIMLRRLPSRLLGSTNARPCVRVRWQKETPGGGAVT